MPDSKSPLISVLMAVYNAEDDVAAAVGSILNQSFADFEFIIINDGSNDRTGAILAALAKQDSRIRLYTQENKGLTASLNQGLKLARGKYIARQDADDVSYQSRLQKQYNLMEGNPMIVLCGGSCDDLYPDGYTAQWESHEPEKLQKIVFLKTPFAHSTAIMRADVARKLGGYDESFKTAQDMEFWMRFAKEGRLAMIAEPLIQRKMSDRSVSARRRGRQFYDSLRARWHNNQGIDKIRGLYHSLRSFMIGCLPLAVIKVRHRQKKQGREQKNRHA